MGSTEVGKSIDQTTSPKGLEGVVAAETKISRIEGLKGELYYRGINIDELAGRSNFEEISYFLWYGALPTQSEFNEWKTQLAASRALAPEVSALLKLFPTTAHPMAVLRTAISAAALYDDESEELTRDANIHKAMRIVAQCPTIVAAFDRLRRGLQPIEPRQELDHVANFLYMLQGKVPEAPFANALSAYYVLLAEHSFNASTFTGRVVIGTRSDMHSAIVGAIGALKGELHGLANQRTMEVLKEIGSLDNVESFVRHQLDQHQRIMGFGHRVYKTEDPRAKHLRALAKELGALRQDLKWFEIAEQLQRTVWKEKQLYINVDFYSAPLLHYIGIPIDLFTTQFACSRSAGWCAHMLEQYADNRLIRPSAQYIGPMNLHYIPIEQRR